MSTGKTATYKMVHNLLQTMKRESKDFSIHVPLYYTKIQTQ